MGTKIPLHLGTTVKDAEDALKRVEHHIAMSMLVGGKGFRQQGKNSYPTRIERISEQYYGKDSD